MKKNPSFTYNISNSKRPQILLIGNGLERGCKSTIPDPKGATNQLTWDELVNAISVEKCVQLSKEEKENLPFPLMYSLLSVPNPAPLVLDSHMIEKEEKRLKSTMNKLSQHSTWRLDILKTLNADHILTTNYSYGLEQSFFPGKDFFNPKIRSKCRFNLNPNTKNDKPLREVNYRMYTGYLAHNQNGSQVGLCIFTASARFHTVLC